jgi:uncharacterized protein (TIGR00251 family)
MSGPPWRVTPDGVELSVRLTPRGGVNRIEGVAEWDGRPVLKVRVTAPPVDGAANDALTDFLARSPGLPSAAIAVAAGAHSRTKRLRLTGRDLPVRLANLVS